jgi:hypothetical protein
MRRLLTVLGCACLVFACGPRTGDESNLASNSTNRAGVLEESPPNNSAAVTADLNATASAPESKSATVRPAETPYPSDPNARFRILSVNRLSNGNIEVLNRRDGPSGTSYSRREISCSAYTYRYLGEGDTLEEAKADSPNPGSMAPLTGTSASSDVADAACRGRK